jgi:hypothetical protein
MIIRGVSKEIIKFIKTPGVSIIPPFTSFFRSFEKPHVPGASFLRVSKSCVYQAPPSPIKKTSKKYQASPLVVFSLKIYQAPPFLKNHRNSSRHQTPPFFRKIQNYQALPI